MSSMNCDVRWATVTGTGDDGQEKVILAFEWSTLGECAGVGTVGMSPLLLIVEINGWKTGQQRMSTSDGEAHCVARFQVVSAVC